MQCNGRYAYQARPAECGDKRTHPAHTDNPPIVCGACGEEANTVPYSMAGEHHLYGPREHEFLPTQAEPMSPFVRRARAGELPGKVTG